MSEIENLAKNTRWPGLVTSRRKHTWIVAVILTAALPFVGSRWLIHDVWVHYALEWTGYVFLVICALGRIWSMVYIGGRKKREVVMIGPYSVMRNPLYFFSFIGVIGIGLSSAMIVFTGFLVVLFLGYYHYVIHREEILLESLHGDAFTEYMKRTPRWIPKLSLWRDYDKVHASPALMTRAVLDASVFLVAFPFMKLIESLQLNGIAHVFLFLP